MLLAALPLCRGALTPWYHNRRKAAGNAAERGFFRAPFRSPFRRWPTDAMHDNQQLPELPARPGPADEAYQRRALRGVSRTFALVIPQLPPDLARVVGNAYLLCRIADIIEDDSALAGPARQEFAERLIALVGGADDAAGFARDLGACMSPGAPADERALIAHTPAVLRITGSFPPPRRRALRRCIGIMAPGMVRYQARKGRHGLADLEAMNDYCYHVAGVVGEMLTELFCHHSEAIARHRGELMRLSVSFGQGLQMTNILKDVWEDWKRGACWLPCAVFRKASYDLSRLHPGETEAGYRRGLGWLIGLARQHLEDALSYTLLIPSRERGIRRFCLWALGMAVLTLRRIDGNRSFCSGQEVKIPRRGVYGTMLVTGALAGSDRALRRLFAAAARSLPSPGEAAEVPFPGSGTAGAKP